MRKIIKVFLLLILIIITTCQVTSANKEVEIVSQINLDKRITLNHITVKGDYLYIPTKELPLDIYIYSFSHQVFEKKISYPLEFGFIPKLHVFQDMVFFVDRQKRSVIFLDQIGRIVRKVVLQSTHPQNSFPGNIFNMVFDGTYLYLNNHFFEEKAYVLQKYDLTGKVLSQTEQFPFINLVKNGKNLYAIYYEIVRKLDDRLQIIDTFQLKGTDFGIDSSYFFHKNLFVALDSKMILHVTDFNNYYKEISLKEYINLETACISDLLFFDNEEMIILVDRSSNKIYGLKLNL